MTRPLTSAELKACGHGWVSRAALDLAVEVTGSNRTADTVAKVKVYGRMAIPHYLLTDRSDRAVVLYSDPTGDVDEPGYRFARSFAFGDAAQLPDPYPVLETATWR